MEAVPLLLQVTLVEGLIVGAARREVAVVADAERVRDAHVAALPLEIQSGCRRQTRRGGDCSHDEEWKEKHLLHSLSCARVHGDLCPRAL